MSAVTWLYLGGLAFFALVAIVNIGAYRAWRRSQCNGTVLGYLAELFRQTWR